MAPNFKKVMAFGKHRSFQAPMPLNTEEPEHDLESGNFLSETQRTDAPIADPKPPGGDNPYLDEYRA